MTSRSHRWSPAWGVWLLAGFLPVVGLSHAVSAAVVARLSDSTAPVDGARLHERRTLGLWSAALLVLAAVLGAAVVTRWQAEITV